MVTPRSQRLSSCSLTWCCSMCSCPISTASRSHHGWPPSTSRQPSSSPPAATRPSTGRSSPKLQSADSYPKRSSPALSSPPYSLPRTGANRHLRYVGAVAAVGAVYWLAAKAGLQLAYLHGSVAALWPPVGVGMALLILYGVSLWPGIVLGDL